MKNVVSQEGDYCITGLMFTIIFVVWPASTVVVVLVIVGHNEAILKGYPDIILAALALFRVEQEKGLFMLPANFEDGLSTGL